MFAALYASSMPAAALIDVARAFTPRFEQLGPVILLDASGLSRLFGSALGMADPSWLAEARDLWSTPAAHRLSVVVPIWRDPWMVVGSPTYTDDLLTRAGLTNALASRDGRYPAVEPADIDDAGADVVLLPDEPYVFTADDGPEALTTPTRLVSGRLLTWYGPAMVEAHAVLTDVP